MMKNLVENRWAFVPVGLLLLSVCICTLGVTLALANGDTAEPDYYQKGAHYDDFKAQLRQNGVIGWVVTPELVASSKDPRLARLELTVADKHGIKIDPATVAVEVIPIRDATRRVNLTLDRVDAGVYAADVPLRSGGNWEFRVQVDALGKHYTDRFRRPVAFGPRKEQGT